MQTPDVICLYLVGRSSQSGIKVAFLMETNKNKEPKGVMEFVDGPATR